MLSGSASSVDEDELWAELNSSLSAAVDDCVSSDLTSTELYDALVSALDATVADCLSHDSSMLPLPNGGGGLVEQSAGAPLGVSDAEPLKSNGGWAELPRDSTRTVMLQSSD